MQTNATMEGLMIILILKTVSVSNIYSMNFETMQTKRSEMEGLMIILILKTVSVSNIYSMNFDYYVG